MPKNKKKKDEKLIEEIIKKSDKFIKHYKKLQMGKVSKK